MRCWRRQHLDEADCQLLLVVRLGVMPMPAAVEVGPCAVRVDFAPGPQEGERWYATHAEAWAARDVLRRFGFQAVRVLAAPEIQWPADGPCQGK